MKKIYINGKDSKYIYDIENNELLLRISDHEDKSEKVNFNTGETFQSTKSKYGTELVVWPTVATDREIEKFYDDQNQCDDCNENSYEDDNGDWITVYCLDHQSEWDDLNNWEELTDQLINNILKKYNLTF